MAISRARRSMSSGPGTPIPLPWSEILPPLGLFSFIHLNYENRITLTCKKLQRESIPGKRIFLGRRFANNSCGMETCELLELKDGGVLAFCEYGNANGAPVFFFHGWPSSRTMGQLAD